MRADQYRGYALECLRFARDMTGPESKAALLEMAQNWLTLADQAEKNERTELVYAPPPPRLKLVG
jgi:hypothetical protein